jgi:hypothetical protein
MAKESLDLFGLTVDLSSTELTQSEVENLRTAPPGSVLYCSDFGIEV